MPVHSGGEASGTVAPDFGGWLPLGARENALEEMGHLFERSELCPIFSALSILPQV